MRKAAIFIIFVSVLCLAATSASAGLTSEIKSPYTKVYGQKKNIFSKLIDLLTGKKDKFKEIKDQYDAKRGIGKYR